MEPLLGNLEASLEISKQKLKEESRLRRQAEVAQVEMEARLQETETLRQENQSLREECDALHEELTFKLREMDKDQIEQIGIRANQRKEARSSGEASAKSTSGVSSAFSTDTETVSNRTKGDSHMDESYAEVLKELEGVTEQLISTQQKLWRTEDKLREAEAWIRDQESGRSVADGSFFDNRA